MTATIVWVLIALLPTALLLPRHLRARADRRQRNVFSRWPIPSVPLDEIDPVFHTGPLGPSLDAEVQFVGGVGARDQPAAGGRYAHEHRGGRRHRSVSGSKCGGVDPAYPGRGALSRPR